MYRVGALLYPQALATSITLPLEILQAAAQLARVRSRHSASVSTVLAAPELTPITLFGGLTLTPETHYQDLDELDLLIIPAIWRNPQPIVAAAAPWLPKLREFADAGTRLCAVGTGACLLAEAGLLDGRPATTHWNYRDEFARRYPKVQLKSRHLITQSDTIYCVGSVNSIADMAVHLIEEWYGDSIARAVENQFSPEIRQPFRAAAYQTGPDDSHHDELVAQAQDILREQLSHPVTLRDIAARLGISDRSLNRRFHQACGTSPRAWLENLRITQARELLRHSNLPTNEVAWQVGISDASHFGKVFKRAVGITPAKYREAVRGKLFTPGVP
ncbi:helix-turn-helix domain-containing protein [Halioglobus maricola]|uniref:Helix-turn-helix domain-containing protein n=2 Tax=Halioglobus maricola TaxID=2601894 RepID=A0A5P9NPP3_9GAMM|nr:helix-turn-helix domain-containing protein [Halioglobus maricola]